MGRIQESKCDSVRYASWDDYERTGLLGQLRLTLEKHVDITRCRPTFRDRPYDQRLAAAHIAGGEKAGNGGRVTGCFHVAAGIELDPELVDQAVANRAGETHREQHQLDIHGEFGPWDCLEFRRRANPDSVQLPD